MCIHTYWSLGSPEREPVWRVLYNIGSTVLLARELKNNAHPEAVVYASHISVHPVASHG